jgi:hypothetical protein
MSKTPRVLLLPPHLIRRSIFVPTLPITLRAPTIEAIVAIPLPTPIHSLATTTCGSYLLTGGADGYIRAYDLWSSVNGGQVMTAQQKSLVGLGEGISKAGVVRGWWSVEVENIGGGGKRKEGVYSMACESDGLWALAGTQVSLAGQTELILLVWPDQPVYPAAFSWTPSTLFKRPHECSIVHDPPARRKELSKRFMGWHSSSEYANQNILIGRNGT